jgi:tetratricopeptide (TPR) repeat protein
MRAVEAWLLITLAAVIMANCGSTGKDNEMSESSSLLQKADSLFNERQQTEALQAYQEAAGKAQAEQDSSNLAEAYSQVARCYLSLDKKGEGRPWLAKAEDMASESKPLGWSRYLSVRGRFEWKDAAEEAKSVSPEAPVAAATFKEMYQFCMDNDLFNRAIDAANMITLTGTMDERVEWGRRGIEAAEKGNVEGWLAPLWNNLGWTYNDLGRYKESLDALMKAREYHYKKGNDKSKLIADWSVGHAYRMNGQLDSAATWMQKVHEWSTRRYDEESIPGNAEWVGFSFKELGEIALTNGDRKTALAHFTEAKKYFAEAGMESWDAKGFEELGDRIEKLSSGK